MRDLLRILGLLAITFFLVGILVMSAGLP